MKDLKINVNDKDGLKKEIRISVPFSAIEEKRTSRFIQIAKTAKLPGFRPGKVPDKVIHQQYGGKVIQEVLSDFLDSTYIESIREKNLKPAGPPEVKILKVKTLLTLRLLKFIPSLNLEVWITSESKNQRLK
jgi:FKBP-type peptidyl-prolyl cis-trans isomerase (trigger factor)